MLFNLLLLNSIYTSLTALTMNKLSLLIAAFITGFATIMQLWLSINVYINDANCRTEFCNDKSSIINKMNCYNSVNNTTTWHCDCRYDGTHYNETIGNVDCWLKISNDFSVFLASLPVFIPLILIAMWREIVMIFKILGCDAYEEFTTFEYFSAFGFIAMVLDPAVFDKKIQSNREEAAAIIIDIGAIGLVFQYSNFIGASFMDPFFLVTLIASCCNALRCVYIVYYINLQQYLKTQQKGVQNPLLQQPPAYL